MTARESDTAELQRQKQYYESLLEISPAAIVVTDLESKVVSWNPAAETLFGYTGEEAHGRLLDDLVAARPELRHEAEGYSRSAAGGGRVQAVAQRTRKDGSLVDVELISAPVVVAGERTGYLVIYYDISELQRQKRYYEALFEISPTAVGTVDTDDIVTSWNPAAEELFGYTRDEAVGRNVDELVASSDEVHAEAVDVSRRAAEEPVRTITRRTRKDGSLVDVDLRVAPLVVAGERVGLFALYHDISELQRQRRYYESLLESSPSAIVTLDLDATVMTWNPGAERLFGYKRDEALGRKIDDLIANRDDVREEAAQMTQRGVKEGQSQLVTRRVRKDGSLVDVHIVGAAIVVGGEQVGLYAIYSDVSELQRARLEAEAANQAKSAFLATMSHEIRTPMNAVIGMTELLLGTQLDDEQRSYAEISRTSGEALLSVINDILDFSKIEAGKLDLEEHAYDLRECIESALELVVPTAGEKGLELAYVLDTNAPEAVVGDAARVRQILLNLLNNAVKFTESGEIVLTVDADRRDDGRYRVHFAVRDTGIGIPPDRVDALFESFSQVDASTTRRYGGTGLGLAISRRLAEAMGATISVESRVGEGSTFHVFVDAAEAPRPARPYEADTVAQLDGKRLLIVDDNATNRQVARGYAESWGMVARDTGSPREALEWVVRGDPFDVAVLDMQMPELDGVALAREIRSRRAAERLPLILLTSLGRREDSAGADFAAHLTKPIRPSQLYNALLDAVADETGRTPAARPETERVTSPQALRVLVAEDNSVNQQLARLLLERLGHRVELAGDGVEALAALERERYDVVLMDVQMPEMDGLAATRRIHERWGASRPRIIAVTAGAMSDERDDCLAAGMDDYLSKPIRTEELSAALAAVGPQGAGSPADERAVERLRETLGAEGTAELIDAFLAEGPTLVAALGEAVDRADDTTLRRAAHTLKSNAATFGATRLADVCARLETLAGSGETSGAAELVTTASDEYEALVRSLAATREETLR
jgi:PAS domain S-box-containing protein